MIFKKKFDHLFLIILAAIIIAADRLTKLLAKNAEMNTGAAFGILPGFNWLFIIIAFAILALFLFFYKKSSKLVQLALILILAGTISNTLDRILFGHVIDFIRIPFIQNSSAFNLADISNITGALILLVSLIKKKD